MTNKSAKKIQNYIWETESSSDSVYIVHYVNPDGDCFIVEKVEWVEEENGYLIHLKSDYLIQVWAEEIDESEIFVYKMINWNKI